MASPNIGSGCYCEWSATCRGRYQIDGHPAALQRTQRCPGLDAASAPGQSQGIQPTVIRPGAHV
jgi:hypothetical protein